MIKKNRKKSSMSKSKWNKNTSRTGLAIILSVTALFSLIAFSLYTNAGGSTVPLTGQVTVATTCTFTTSNAAINFGTVGVGTNTIGTTGNTLNNYAVMNVITVTNGGTSVIGSNVFLSGSNWNFNANSFTVTNTVWSGVSGNTAWNPLSSSSKTSTSNVEVTLTGSTADTYNSLGPSGTATFWFGVNVPTTAAGYTYSQTINVISSC